jgi:uncharacterized protein
MCAIQYENEPAGAAATLCIIKLEETTVLIAAISDTHLGASRRTLPGALVERLRTVDLILHAGDIATAAALEQIRAFAPVEAVRGNVDEPELQLTLPRTRVVPAGRFRIGIVHGDGVSRTTLERASRAFAHEPVDCIVFGHSHSPYLLRHDGLLMLNPGSPTDKRREPRASFALITVGDTLEAEIIYL